MSNSEFKTVTIAGGTGNVGHIIAEAFLDDGSYKIKILRRKPENVNERAITLASKGAEIIYVDYRQNYDLVKALKGTDVLISALNFDPEGATFHDSQAPLLAAAKDASVKRFIPSEFGIKMKANTHPITDDRIRFREEIEKSGLEYTYIFIGLSQELLCWCGFNIEDKKATFYDDGNKKLPTTSLSDVGKYTVEALKMPEARNSEITVAGANLSLNEYLDIFEKVSGSKWKAVVDKEVRYRYQQKKASSFAENFMAVVVQESEFEKLDNDKFSFTPRPVSEVIKELVKQASE